MRNKVMGFLSLLFLSLTLLLFGCSLYFLAQGKGFWALFLFMSSMGCTILGVLLSAKSA